MLEYKLLNQQTVQQFLAEKQFTRSGGYVRIGVMCSDGFKISIQASEYHYCTPRDNYGPWSNVELGYPSQADDLIQRYAETPEDPTQTVYGYVPIETVQALIEKHNALTEG